MIPRKMLVEEFNAGRDGWGVFWWACDCLGHIGVFAPNAFEAGGQTPTEAFSNESEYIAVWEYFDKLEARQATSGFVWRTPPHPQKGTYESDQISSIGAGLFYYHHVDSTGCGDSRDAHTLIGEPTVPLMLEDCPQEIQTALEKVRFDDLVFGQASIRVYLHFKCR
jgi:hypothetical protein